MLFNSFFFFYILVLSIYWRCKHRTQNVLLLLARFFLLCWYWRFLSLIVLSTSIDFFCAGNIEKGDDRKKKVYPWISILMNLSILGTFKYYNFFVESFCSLLSAINIPSHPGFIELLLPVGISYYTFKTLSYSIDVYRWNIRASRSFLEFSLFVALFPKLLARPIERAGR